MPIWEVDVKYKVNTPTGGDAFDKILQAFSDAKDKKGLMQVTLVRVKEEDD